MMVVWSTAIHIQRAIYGDLNFFGLWFAAFAYRMISGRSTAHLMASDDVPPQLAIKSDYIARKSGNLNLNPYRELLMSR